MGFKEALRNAIKKSGAKGKPVAKGKGKPMPKGKSAPKKKC